MAAVNLPPVPNPPPPDVVLIDPQTGRPTRAETDYRIQVRDWMRKLKTAVEGLS